MARGFSAVTIEDLTSEDRERFESLVYQDPNCGCALYFGPSHERGYGRFNVRNKSYHAHWVAWVLGGGRPHEKGLELAHVCDTPSCVNPDHLRIGSHWENMADMAIKGRGRSDGRFPYGVIYYPRCKSRPYRARVVFKRKHITWGSFRTPEEASAAALAKKAELYGL